MATNPKPVAVESTITQVVVYSDRALVTRSAEVSLGVGENTLEFMMLPESMDQQSLQVPSYFILSQF